MMKKLMICAAVLALVMTGCTPEQSEFNFADIQGSVTVQGIVKINKGYTADENGVLNMISENADPEKLDILAYTDYADYDATGKAQGAKTWPGTAAVKDGLCVFSITIPSGSQGITVNKILIRSTEPMKYGQVFQGGVEEIVVNYEKEVAIGKLLAMNDTYIVPKMVALAPAEKDLDEMLTGSYEMELYGWATAAIEEEKRNSDKEIIGFKWGETGAVTKLFVILKNANDQVLRTTIEANNIKSDGYYSVTFNLPKQPSWDVTSGANVDITIQALPYRVSNFTHWYYNSEREKWTTQDDVVAEYPFKEVTDKLNANDGYKGEKELKDIVLGSEDGEISFYSDIFGLGDDVDYKNGERIYWNNDGSVYNRLIVSSEHQEEPYNPKGNNDPIEPSEEGGEHGEWW